MSELELITDRTQQDVAYAQQLLQKGFANFTEADMAAYESLGMKGVYNASDCMRVEDAVKELSEILNERGYNVTVKLQDDFLWFYCFIFGIPMIAELQEPYLANIRAIRSAFPTLPTTPEVPDSMSRMTYVEANAIEQILTDVNLLLNNMIASTNYSGDLYGGEL